MEKELRLEIEKEIEKLVEKQVTKITKELDSKFKSAEAIIKKIEIFEKTEIDFNAILKSSESRTKKALKEAEDKQVSELSKINDVLEDIALLTIKHPKFFKKYAK